MPERLAKMKFRAGELETGSDPEAAASGESKAAAHWQERAIEALCGAQEGRGGFRQESHRFDAGAWLWAAAHSRLRSIR